MPGIVGLISGMPRAHALRQLETMVESLCHEEFYNAGVWCEEQSGIYVGWVAQENSFADRMPIRNETGDIVLTFSGEEFPQPGTVERLRQRGHAFDSTSCAYLVHLYEDDPSFPSILNGRFHGLLLDRRQGLTTLFNDRYGMHRICYHQSKEAFYFAAEAKAILAVCPELRRINLRSLGEFFACGSVLENRTLFNGIEVLPPASAWVFQNASVKKKNRYFHPNEWEDQGTLDAELFYPQLREAFAESLPLYFQGNQPVAMSLTGGLDTRMIMSWRKPRPGTLPCYTFGGMLRDCKDIETARKVALTCQQSHEVIRIGEEFFRHFPRYAERAVYFTDGCVDVSRAPDLYLNERAREIAPVRMTGLYGGEILRGVRAFKPETPNLRLFSRDVLSLATQAAETYNRLARQHPVSFSAFSQAPWHHYGSLALEQSQLCMRTPFLDNRLVQAVYRAPLAALKTNEVSRRLISDGEPALLEIPTDRGPVAGHGVALQSLTHGALEFLFKAEYAYDMGMPQWLARINHALSPLQIERLFLGRHKITHFRIWYKDIFSEYIRETLLDPQSLSRPHINRKALETAVRGHIEGHRNYTTEIHKLMTLEIVHRLFLENSPKDPSAKRPQMQLRLKRVIEHC